VALGILVQRRKHYGQDYFHVVADEVAEIFIVPEVESTLSHLEMWTCDRLCELVEERFLNLGELCWVHHFEDVFHFIEEHYFFSAVYLGPVPKEPEDDLDLSALLREPYGKRTSSVNAASFSRN
jgi:hypothetical protein